MESFNAFFNGLASVLFASTEELRREYVGKLDCFSETTNEPEPVRPDPSGISLLVLHEGSVAITVSIVNVSISARSGKTSANGSSGGLRSIDDTSGFC